MGIENTTPVWPGWETVRLIGQGGFGSVYEIERDQNGIKEKAALKMISIPWNKGDIEELFNEGYDEESITSTFKAYMQSLVAEYALMRKLSGNTNIVNCDDFRTIKHDDGIGWDIYIRMELLTPLTKALTGSIPEATVIRVGKDICRALMLCRKHGIVHRDIKPQNIFLSENGDYKLGDFGVAKVMEKTTGATKTGTYRYMAPEVNNNQPYNSQADIYSFGLVLYWLLNERRLPFMPLPPVKLDAHTEEESRLRRFRGEEIPAPAHGSEALKRIVLKACAYDPGDRYLSAEEMLSDLELAESDMTPGIGIDIKPKRPKKDPPRTPALEQRRDHVPAEDPVPKPVKKQDHTIRIMAGIIALLALCLVILLAVRSTDRNKTGETTLEKYAADMETPLPAPITPTPTAEPTPTPTPSPTPTPTPTSTATPTPTPKNNSYESLIKKAKAYDSSLTFPKKSEMLSKPVTRYVMGSYPQSKSGGINLCKAPYKDAIKVLSPHTRVTVYAVRSGSLEKNTGCAFIKTSSGEYGWVSLKTKYNVGLSETDDF